MHVCSLCSVLELGRARMKKPASFSPHHFMVEGTEIKETKKYPDVLFQKHLSYPWILPFLHGLTSQSPPHMGMNFCMDFGVDKTDHSKGTERDGNRPATHCPRAVPLKPDFGTVIVADRIQTSFEIQLRAWEQNKHQLGKWMHTRCQRHFPMQEDCPGAICYD